MILNYSWAVWLTWLLGAFLAINGLLSLAGLPSVRGAPFVWSGRRLARLPSGFACVAAGLMIVWYPSRPFGLLLGLLLCVAACAVLLGRRDFARLPPPVILALAIVATAWGLRLI